MPSPTRRSLSVPLAVAFGLAILPIAPTAPLAAQSTGTGTGASNGTVVIVVGSHAEMPIPTLMESGAGGAENFDVADQLFLKLAGLGPTLATTNDKTFTPLLAQRWTHRDSVTVVFDLDPRARWHDGAPVLAKDVVFTFGRARNPAIAPTLAQLLRHIVSVEAESDRRVVFRYDRPYPEQVYDAIQIVAPLPSHLLDTIPPEDWRRSAFVRAPVGSGPYRWVRNVPGEFIELGANPAFFLGHPNIQRVVFRHAADPEARINLLLSGEGDTYNNVIPPLTNIDRFRQTPDLRLIPVPSPSVGYVLMNQRARSDSTHPHPILGDIRVRRALIAALDRDALVRSVYGPYGSVPYGPTSPYLSWLRQGAPAPAKRDTAAARRLLAEAGWRDADGDQVLDHDGRPLTLQLNYPASSLVRRQMAQLIQQQLRDVGVQIELNQVDFPVYLERRSAGNFDLDFSSTSQDPSPSSLTQGWSCRGGTNAARFCDAVVDSLMERAIGAPRDPNPIWRAALQRIESDAAAAFVYAPVFVAVLHRRFTDVTIHPESLWRSIWQWRVSAGRELPRDRTNAR